MNVHKAGPKTALQRQQQRLARLASRGVHRSTVMVQDECRAALDSLRPLLLDPERASVLAALAEEAAKQVRVVNVGQVAKLSPFRFPGGKTWLVPEVGRWISALPRRPNLYVEPFAGGASVGVAVASNSWARQVVLCELDPDIASVWSIVFGPNDHHAERLGAEIAAFEPTRSNVERVLQQTPERDDVVERAFRTLLRNRTSRGGVMANGAGLLREGDRGRGVAARWYAGTIVERLAFLRSLRDRVRFVHGDGAKLIETHAEDPDAVFFVDPPYTLTREGAGRRLYGSNRLSHAALFESLEQVKGAFMATYDDSVEVRSLASRHGFVTRRVAMRTAHHRDRFELLVLGQASRPEPDRVVHGPTGEPS